MKKASAPKQPRLLSSQTAATKFREREKDRMGEEYPKKGRSGRIVRAFTAPRKKNEAGFGSKENRRGRILPSRYASFSASLICAALFIPAFTFIAAVSISLAVSFPVNCKIRRALDYAMRDSWIVSGSIRNF